MAKVSEERWEFVRDADTFSAGRSGWYQFLIEESKKEVSLAGGGVNAYPPRFTVSPRRGGVKQHFYVSPPPMPFADFPTAVPVLLRTADGFDPGQVEMGQELDDQRTYSRIFVELYLESRDLVQCDHAIKKVMYCGRNRPIAYRYLAEDIS